MAITFRHTDDKRLGKIFVEVDGKEAGYIKYTWLPNDNLKADGTLVYDEFRTQKLGAPLFDKLISYAQELGVKIYPTCPFVVKTFARRPELKELLAADYLQEQEAK